VLKEAGDNTSQASNPRRKNPCLADVAAGIVARGDGGVATATEEEVASGENVQEKEEPLTPRGRAKGKTKARS